MRSLMARALRVGLLALPVALSTSCMIDPDPADCDGPRSCDACIERSGCGWCPTVGCVPGTSLGSDDESLSCGGDFRFSECDGIPPGAPTVSIDRCGQASSCGACVADGCGWCRDTAGGHCIGSEVACGSGQPVVIPNRCGFGSERYSCDGYTDCSGCAGDPGCQFEVDALSRVEVYCSAEVCRPTGFQFRVCVPRDAICE